MKLQRGRPAGVKNGEGTGDKWVPKTWKPLYETIVTQHVLGVKSKEIASQLNITPVLVSYILNSDKALERIKELTKQHNLAIAETKKEKIKEILESSVDNVHNVVAQGHASKVSLALFEASLKALKAFDPNIKDDDEVKNNTTIINNTQINNTQVNQIATNQDFLKRISSGLDKLEEIKSIHAPTRTG